ncbi:Hsp20/alpha crystallin family protein [Demequina rhizosphaerae]|uniref:Hsp20/alpha crystallin family protein n=1 Tax=Demequina rhizosphaerae TaxID=1638985 RepID=UPI0007815A09|nr:Hsp20/alpha crystallin family protein [Demequina rhizosphaerae]
MAREVLRRSVPASAASPWPDEFQRLVQQFFGDTDTSLAGAFSPALDVEETEDGYTMHVELPGVKPEEVDVSLEENVLTVSGERNFYEEKTAEGFRRVERRFGRFHRAVRLPDRVDPDNVKATYKDGLLTVTVPKSEAAKPRRIEVGTD